MGQLKRKLKTKPTRILDDGTQVYEGPEVEVIPGMFMKNSVRISNLEPADPIKSLTLFRDSY